MTYHWERTIKSVSDRLHKRQINVIYANSLYPICGIEGVTRGVPGALLRHSTTRKMASL